MKTIKRKIKVFILTLMALIVAGCNQKPQEESFERVNIAFPEWIGYGPLYLADELGYFQEEGVSPVFINEESDMARGDAFKQGMLDIEVGTLDLLVSKRARGTAVTAVLIIDYSRGADGIVAEKEIKTIEDLKGKRITFARDNVGETFISYLFYKRGLALDDVTIIPSATEDVWQLYLEDGVDAAVTWEPWLSKAAQRPGGHILISTKEEPVILINTLNVSENLIKNNPELLKKIMRTWFKGVKYYRENPIEASNIIAKYYGLPANQYREQIKGVEWVDYQGQIAPGETEKIKKIFNLISKIKFINKRIRKQPDVLGAINFSLLENLYENSR